MGGGGLEGSYWIGERQFLGSLVEGEGKRIVYIDNSVSWNNVEPGSLRVQVELFLFIFRKK